MSTTFCEVFKPTYFVLILHARYQRGKLVIVSPGGFEGRTSRLKYTQGARLSLDFISEWEVRALAKSELIHLFLLLIITLEWIVQLAHIRYYLFRLTPDYHNIDSQTYALELVTRRIDYLVRRIGIFRTK